MIEQRLGANTLDPVVAYLSTHAFQAHVPWIRWDDFDSAQATKKGHDPFRCFLDLN
jgi:hypothetical protein